MPLDPQLLKDLKEKLSQATPRPWKVVSTPQGIMGKNWKEIESIDRNWVVTSGQYHSSRYGDVSGVRIRDVDAELIVTLLNHAEELIEAASKTVGKQGLAIDYSPR